MKTLREPSYRPTLSQLNFAYLDTVKVQYWVGGVMTTLVSIEEARELVRTKRAFVISSQAIGAMDELGYSIA